jgi:hypothetical protein
MATNCVGIYLDFENLAITAETVYPREEMPLQIEPIVDYATNKGTIAIKKAYANWNYPMFRQYQRVLVEMGFELIHLPETTIQGKSWADIRLTIAILEDIHLHPHIQTVIVGSQDTDFVPLLQTVKTKGLDVIVAGFGQFVGNLLKKNSTEFVSLTDLFSAETEPEAVNEEEEYDLDGLFRRLLSAHSSEEPIFMTNLKQSLLKLDPSFSERQLGFNSFSIFVRSLVGKYVERIDRAKDKGVDVVFLKDLGRGRNKPQSKSSPKTKVTNFIATTLRFLRNVKQRKDIIRCIMTDPGFGKGLTIPEIVDNTKKEFKLPGDAINKFVLQLYNAGVLIQEKSSPNGPLYSRLMVPSDDFSNDEAVDKAYIDRMRYLISAKFPTLSQEEISTMLGV